MRKQLAIYYIYYIYIIYYILYHIFIFYAIYIIYILCYGVRIMHDELLQQITLKKQIQRSYILYILRRNIVTDNQAVNILEVIRLTRDCQQYNKLEQYFLYVKTWSHNQHANKCNTAVANQLSVTSHGSFSVVFK